MKKNYFILIAFIAVIIACNKEVLTNEEIQIVSFANAKALSGNEREVMLTSMSQDPLFQDYLTTLIDIQKVYEQQFTKIKNYDADKWKAIRQPKNDADFIAVSKGLGLSDPELMVSKYKEANAKLAKLYKKYPNFSNSMNEEEKKDFFKKATLKFYAK